jgi:hypothetical protein
MDGFYNATTGILRQLPNDLNLTKKSFNDENVYLPFITFVFVPFLRDLYKY